MNSSRYFTQSEIFHATHGGFCDEQRDYNPDHDSNSSITVSINNVTLLKSDAFFSPDQNANLIVFQSKLVFLWEQNGNPLLSVPDNVSSWTTYMGTYVLLITNDTYNGSF